jgi:2-polyprenyl-3-methyl-5-hydroxy-6-metoxy-1,4-benzoquinol methylase
MMTGKKFFIEYDRYKFSTEPHIVEELNKIEWKNKKVLEIGVGQGAEAQVMIEKGALYNGIDTTNESIK